ncbi:hypothetical protein R3P38DRAFT_3275395 [Favolaschia claudopus]|uniref:Uncharacterized protein n=1 Tax=Favolaschia claudopus TaxID=2862362 RepID=A0AAW0AUP0_9AGAR
MSSPDSSKPTFSTTFDPPSLLVVPYLHALSHWQTVEFPLPPLLPLPPRTSLSSRIISSGPLSVIHPFSHPLNSPIGLHLPIHTVSPSRSIRLLPHPSLLSLALHCFLPLPPSTSFQELLIVFLRLYTPVLLHAPPLFHLDPETDDLETSLPFEDRHSVLFSLHDQRPATSHGIHLPSMRIRSSHHRRHPTPPAPHPPGAPHLSISTFLLSFHLIMSSPCLPLRRHSLRARLCFALPPPFLTFPPSFLSSLSPSRPLPPRPPGVHPPLRLSPAQSQSSSSSALLLPSSPVESRRRHQFQASRALAFVRHAALATACPLLPLPTRHDGARLPYRPSRSTLS